MITVLGAGGFIGSHLVNKLNSLNIRHYAPQRNENLQDKNLGDIIYCIGLTADFRERPFETIEAHVSKVLEIVRNCNFDTFLYLSSTRIYGLENIQTEENSSFKINPGNPSDLYNISKIMGEALLHASEKPVRIARLSNVYGKDFNSKNFLSEVIKQAVNKNHIVLETTLESEKDYINVNDVVDILIKIASKGKHLVYNVASGRNISNREIMEHLSSLTHCQINVLPEAKTVKFPRIEVERIHSEFGYQSSGLLADLKSLVEFYTSQYRE